MSSGLIYRIADGEDHRLDVVIDEHDGCPIRIRLMKKLSAPDDGYRRVHNTGVSPGAARALATALCALADELDPERADVWELAPKEGG
jgi:hypothetical protein